MLGAATGGLNVGTLPKGLGQHRGLYPFRGSTPGWSGEGWPRMDGSTAPANCPQFRRGSLPCHGHSPLPQQWLPDPATDLYLTNQALHSMTDLPAGSLPHMLHVTKAEARVPTNCDGAWGPWPPHLHGKGCPLQGDGWPQLGSALGRGGRASPRHPV